MKKTLLIALACSALFIVGFLLLGLSFWLTAILVIVLYVGLTLLWNPSSPAERLPDMPGMSREEAYALITAGKAKTESIRSLAAKIDNPEVRAQVSEIAAVAERIFAELERDPKDITLARRFVDYYFDTTLLVIRRYIDLSTRGSGDADVGRALQSFEEMVSTILETFRKQHAKLLRDDALDFDTDVTVLRQMMESEGL